MRWSSLSAYRSMCVPIWGVLILAFCLLWGLSNSLSEFSPLRNELAQGHIYRNGDVSHLRQITGEDLLLTPPGMDDDGDALGNSSRNSSRNSSGFTTHRRAISHPPADPPLHTMAVLISPSTLYSSLDEISSVYAEHLLEGYRYALLTGTPWAIAFGSPAQCRCARQYLRALPHPAFYLFPANFIRTLPYPLNETAASLHQSMRGSPTLEHWVAKARVVPALSVSASARTMHRQRCESGGEGVDDLASAMELYRDYGMGGHPVHQPVDPNKDHRRRDYQDYNNHDDDEDDSQDTNNYPHGVDGDESDAEYVVADSYESLYSSHDANQYVGSANRDGSSSSSSGGGGGGEDVWSSNRWFGVWGDDGSGAGEQTNDWQDSGDASEYASRTSWCTARQMVSHLLHFSQQQQQQQQQKQRQAGTAMYAVHTSLGENAQQTDGRHGNRSDGLAMSGNVVQVEIEDDGVESVRDLSESTRTSSHNNHEDDDDAEKKNDAANGGGDEFVLFVSQEGSENYTKSEMTAKPVARSPGGVGDRVSHAHTNLPKRAVNMQATRLIYQDKVPFLIPGILSVASVQPEERVARVAVALRRMMERVALERQRKGRRRKSSGHRQTRRGDREAEEDNWWTLTRNYAVVLMSNYHEQQHLRLLFMNALRRATTASLRRMHSLMQRHVAHTYGPAQRGESSSSATHLHAIWSLLSKFEAQNVHLFFSQPNVSSFMLNFSPKPKLLPFTGTLPENVNPHSSWLARRIAVYSCYLYRNYERWIDAIRNVGALIGLISNSNMLQNMLLDWISGRISYRDIM